MRRRRGVRPREVVNAERKAAAEARKIERDKARLKAKAEMVRLMPWLDKTLTDAERYRLRYNLDPAFNASERNRRRIKKKTHGSWDNLLRSAIGRNGRSPKCEDVLGYSASELWLHLERQFSSDMTREAFLAGEIHIDHIVPLAHFNLSTIDGVRAAWALSNLQPLWATDNLKKRDKLVHKWRPSCTPQPSSI